MGMRSNFHVSCAPVCGECLQTLEGHSNWVNSVSFSPDAVLADPACERILRARRCFAARGGDQILTLRQKKDRKAVERRKWRVAKKKGLAMGGAREEAKAQLQSLRQERSKWSARAVVGH